MAEPVIIPALAGAAPDAPETLKTTNIADTIMVGARVRTHHPALPRPVVVSPAANGNAAHRPWGKWTRREPHGAEDAALPGDHGAQRETGRHAGRGAGVRLAHLVAPATPPKPRS